LQKTPTFRAAEDEYGVGTARGIQFGYFVLMLTGVMLAVTVFANVLVRIAPDSYSDAAPLIPLLAAGLVSPTVYRMLNKSVKYRNKRIPFIIGAVVAACLFVGLTIVMVDPIGVEAAPLAMMIGFALPALVIFYRSQTGRTPIRLPWRSMLTGIGLAVVIVLLHARLDVTSGIVGETLVGLFAVALWLGLITVTGVIPAYHRGALKEMALSLVGRGRAGAFTPAEGLAAIERPQRRALRRAILGRKPAPEATAGLIEVDGGDEARTLVEVLRRVAVQGGIPGLPKDYDATDERDRDQAIGEFLFAPGPIAGRDQIGKRLINDGVAEAYDLHTLELTITALRATPRPVWKNPG
jgi:hypothetical protein